MAIVSSDDRMHLRLGQAARRNWRKSKHRGLASVSTDFMLNLIACGPGLPSETADGVRSASVHNIPTAPKPEAKGQAQCTNP